MSITDELRTWMYGHTVNCSDNRIALVAIADRIDATYEEDVNTACKLANSLSADELDERGWIRLPVDADGEPLRVGDEIEYPNGARDTVRFATISPIGWAVNDRGWKPEAMRHHHPPTVEDVLREFAESIKGQNADFAELVIAEYAAKLRLAGDGE